MLIICPSCSTSYRVEPSSLGAGGRQVRCARCRTTWLATAESSLATADAGPDREGPGDGVSGDAGQDAAAGWENAGEPAMSEWTAAEAAGEPPASSDIADPDAVADSPSLVPEQDGDRVADAAATIDPLREDIETIASRRAGPAPKAGKRWKPKLARPRLPVVIVTLVIVLGALLQWRSTVVRVFPQTGSLFGAIGLPVNLRGMTFESLKTSQELQDGVPVLVVEGTIVNKTRSALEVPRLRFALRNRMGQEIYAWTASPPRSDLAPEEYVAFRSRLASPPMDGRDVVVRFFTRRDIASGLQ
ncbi:MAG: MJ0042-type zinc finger domain-containing protein [Xanthobacteraceae bacterium]|jgi:predicted Zn finger-like uncharacterized protein